MFRARVTELLSKIGLKLMGSTPDYRGEKCHIQCTAVKSPLEPESHLSLLYYSALALLRSSREASQRAVP
jgi:hypothetical protein